MKIGVNLWIWVSPFRTDQHLSLVANAKALGAESIEFGFEDDAVVDPRALRSALEDQNLECSVRAVKLGSASRMLPGK